MVQSDMKGNDDVVKWWIYIYTLSFLSFATIYTTCIILLLYIVLSIYAMLCSYINVCSSCVYYMPFVVYVLLFLL